MNQNLKCIVLGESECGKTSLLNLFMRGEMSDSASCVNTRYNVNFMAKLTDVALNASELAEFKLLSKKHSSSSYSSTSSSVNEHLNYSFKLYDYEMSQTNEMQFLRENELNEPDLLIYCYKSGSRLSESVVSSLCERWGKIPIVLVSCKADILDFNVHNLSFETTSRKLTSKFGASLHMYCSSFKKLNVDKVFNESFKIAIRHKIRTTLLKRQLNSQTSKKMNNYNYLATKGLLKSSKLFMSISEEEDEQDVKKSITFVKSLFTLFGFALFLFYVLTNKLAKRIPLGELNLMKEVLDEVGLSKTYNNLFLQ